MVAPSREHYYSDTITQTRIPGRCSQIRQTEVFLTPLTIKQTNQKVKTTSGRPGPPLCTHTLKCLTSQVPLAAEKERLLPISHHRGINKRPCSRSDGFLVLSAPRQSIKAHFCHPQDCRTAVFVQPKADTLCERRGDKRICRKHITEI